MNTREQDNAVARLALQYGRVHVRDGYVDNRVEATLPNGAMFRITEDGTTTQARTGDFSVDWSHV